MANLIEIGKIVNTHGIRGEVKVTPWCDDPTIYCDLSYFYAAGQKYEILRARVHKSSVIIELDGVVGIDAAIAMRNKVITIERDVLGDLDDGVYYICDLIGVAVENDDGQALGNIKDVIKTGSNDVYVLTSGVLVPALKDVILEVDITEKRMTVRLPDGLLDLN
ncbi:MAG: ribosome maturation factor RimM [Oscillospiraceae bacterium]|nr:ribosome maturation factor RimM [Oscillospiraceae bacterium]